MTTETCKKCQHKYQSTRNAPNCPRCSARETQTITSSDIDTGSILSAVIDGVAHVVSDVGASSSDTFEGGGGDSGGGGASGDW